MTPRSRVPSVASSPFPGTACPGRSQSDTSAGRPEKSQLVHREAIKQPDAAPADQIALAAAGGGVRGVPRLVPVADEIGMADLRGAGAVARPVVARVIRRVGERASIGLRAGQDVVARRQRVANAVDQFAVFRGGEFLRQVAAATRLVQCVSMDFRLDERPLKPAPQIIRDPLLRIVPRTGADAISRVDGRLTGPGLRPSQSYTGPDTRTN